MTEPEIREKHRALLNDPNFDKIRLELRKPNIFQILDISQVEIRHSNFLSWLLDPNGTHGLGEIFLTKFLLELTASEKAAALDEFGVGKLNFTNAEIRREWQKIDLLIIFDTLVVCIENKIKSHDHSNQLSRYKETVDKNFKNHRKLFVYLTRTGEEPKAIGQNYITYSYESIIDQLGGMLEIHGDSLKPEVRQYISDYLTILKRELMKDDKLNDLADKIYNKHRELFEFVNDYKSDALRELHEIFVEKIEDKKDGKNWVLGSSKKRFVRFTTRKLVFIMPQKGLDDWQSKESFLFEFHISWHSKRVKFKTIIARSDPVIERILVNALKNVPGYKKSNRKNILVNFEHAWKFGDKDMTEVDREDFLEKLKNEWPKITGIVNKVEAGILKHSTELKKYC